MESLSAKMSRSLWSVSQCVSKKTDSIKLRISARELGLRLRLETGLSRLRPAASTRTSLSMGVKCAPPESSATYKPEIQPPRDSPIRLAFSTLRSRRNRSEEHTSELH